MSATSQGTQDSGEGVSAGGKHWEGKELSTLFQLSPVDHSAPPAFGNRMVVRWIPRRRSATKCRVQPLGKGLFLYVCKVVARMMEMATQRDMHCRSTFLLYEKSEINL